MNFSDYQQFYFPTVKVSAWKIARAFGIESILQKYDRSKTILEDLIEKHNTEIAKSEGKLENRLLLVLAILSGIEPLSMGLELWLNNAKLAYALSIALLGSLWFAFFAIRKLKHRKMRKEAEYHTAQAEKKEKRKKK